MNTKSVKKPAAFRFDEYLLKRLKSNAKKENRSLNNYVETLLKKTVFNEPNEETKEAIEEVRAGIYAGEIDTSSYEAFLKSIDE